MTRPLAGRRVLVTRATHQAGRLSAKLAELGAEAIEIPAIALEPPVSFAALDAAVRDLSQYPLLIFTSANAVAPLLERMRLAGFDAGALTGLRVAAIGPATARALEAAGIAVQIIPEEYVAESLLDALEREPAAQRVLLVRAETARDLIPDSLRARGADVTVVDAYRTVVPRESVEKLRLLLAEGKPLPDAATFTSSSSVTNFLRLLQEARLERPAGLNAISIGPITSATLREVGWEPVAEADPHDIDGLVDAVVRFFS